jgi:hypothetical protein
MLTIEIWDIFAMHFRRVQNNSHHSCRHNEARLERLSKYPTSPTFAVLKSIKNDVLPTVMFYQRSSVELQRACKVNPPRTFVPSEDIFLPPSPWLRNLVGGHADPPLVGVGM